MLMLHTELVGPFHKDFLHDWRLLLLLLFLGFNKSRESRLEIIIIIKLNMWIKSWPSYKDLAQDFELKYFQVVSLFV